MVVLLPAVLVASHLIQASAVVCPAGKIEIRISEDVKPPHIDDSKTNLELKTMTVPNAVSKDPRFAETTGITAATIAVDSEIRTKSAGPENGPVCVSPTVVSIRLSTAPNIYIDTSHGACRQSVAMEHEMGHVTIDHELIDRFMPIFRTRVATMAEAIGSVPAGSYDDASAVRERIEEKINAMLSVTYDSMAIERALKHQEHDSPEEYRRVSTACPAISIDAPAVAPHAPSRRGDSTS